MTISISTVSGQEKERLTNDIIIEMTKAGLGENVVINKIRISEPSFDLSTKAIIKLKENGINDKIINAMIETQNLNSQLNLKQQVTGEIQNSSSGDIFISRNDKLSEMEYMAGFTKNLSNYSVYYLGNTQSKFAIMASGKQAQMRIKDKSPVFYSRINPGEISIVKFDTDTYDGKSVRYITRAGDWIVTSARTLPPGEDSIDFNFQKEVNGLYKITIKKYLNNGEYGIV